MRRLVLGMCMAALAACAPPSDGPSAPAPAPTPPAEVPDAAPKTPRADPTGEPPTPLAAEAEAARPTVVLVVLRSFPDELLDAVEAELASKLGISVERYGTVELPQDAYYKPRRRYRADTLLDHLDTYAQDAPHTTKVLGLTQVDISTTNGDIKDWGIFGLGTLDGRSAVISSYRLRRKAKPAKVKFRVTTTALHEVGHTFGLPHCTEPRCVMLDAEGGITNTDTSSGEFGPSCRAGFEAATRPD